MSATATLPQCDGAHGCASPVTHIDRKGYVYCNAHALRGRRLTKAETARLAAGLTLARY